MKEKIKLLSIVCILFASLASSYGQDYQANSGRIGKKGTATGKIATGLQSFSALSYSDNSIFKQNYWTVIAEGTNQYGNKIYIVARNYKDLSKGIKDALWECKIRNFNSCFIIKYYCLNVTNDIVRKNPFPSDEISLFKKEIFRKLERSPI